MAQAPAPEEIPDSNQPAPEILSMAEWDAGLPPLPERQTPSPTRAGEPSRGILALHCFPSSLPCPLPGRRRSGNGSVSDRPGQFGRNLGLVTDDDGNVFELEDIRVFHPDCTFACWMVWHTASGGDGEVSSPWIWRRRG
jgi:hypothetical protein